MNKYIYALICAFVITSSCKKTEDPAPAPTPPDPQEAGVSPVPSSFTQKVLMEIFTGAGQSQCTDGFVKEYDITAAYSVAIPVRIHYSDAMEIPYYTTMETTFNGSVPPTMPSAMINRTPSLGTVILNRTQWLSNFINAKSKTAACGLAMKTKVTESQASIEVHAGFSQTMTGDHTLTVLLIENNVTGTGSQYDQRNAYNTTAGHAYYNAGDPILNFNHNNTLRKAITADEGELIPQSSMTAGGEYVKTYSVNISGYKQQDLYVVAFITKKGTTATTHQVMNVQKAKMGTLKDWD